jgi:hypothetical protein
MITLLRVLAVFFASAMILSSLWFTTSRSLGHMLLILVLVCIGVIGKRGLQTPMLHFAVASSVVGLMHGVFAYFQASDDYAARPIAIGTMVFFGLFGWMIWQSRLANPSNPRKA